MRTGFKLGSSRALPAGLICSSSSETISISNSTLPWREGEMEQERESKRKRERERERKERQRERIREGKNEENKIIIKSNITLTDRVLSPSSSLYIGHQPLTRFLSKRFSSFTSRPGSGSCSSEHSSALLAPRGRPAR